LLDTYIELVDASSALSALCFLSSFMAKCKNQPYGHQEHSKQIRSQQLIPLIGAEARRSNNEQFVVVE
jgi:hypothetical protein